MDCHFRLPNGVTVQASTVKQFHASNKLTYETHDGLADGFHGYVGYGDTIPRPFPFSEFIVCMDNPRCHYLPASIDSDELDELMESLTIESLHFYQVCDTLSEDYIVQYLQKIYAGASITTSIVSVGQKYRYRYYHFSNASGEEFASFEWPLAGISAGFPYGLTVFCCKE